MTLSHSNTLIYSLRSFVKLDMVIDLCHVVNATTLYPPVIIVVLVWRVAWCSREHVWLLINQSSVWNPIKGSCCWLVPGTDLSMISQSN